MNSERKQRPAARILLFDPDGRILLFRFDPPDRPPFWVTPGGAVDPGETYEQAAERELFEETGFRSSPGPQVARVIAEFISLEGVPVVADERFFCVRLGRGANPDAIATDGHTELERAVMRSWRWFDRHALAALDEPYFPEDLIELIDRHA